MSSQHAFTYRQSVINTYSFGHGPRLMLAFPGYGKTAESMLVLEPSLQSRYTVVVVELFFHGSTQWNEPHWPASADWQAIINLVLQAYGSPGRFTLMGYSLGGRIAIYTTALMPLHVEKLILIGSDGLGMDRFYHFATRNRIGSKLFRRFVEKPGFIEKPLQWAYRRKWISESLYQFIWVKMDTVEKRQLLYRRWMSTGDLLTPPRRAAHILQEYGIDTLLIMGRNDKVIPYRLGERFVQWYTGAKLIGLDQGHHIINAGLNGVLAEHL